MDGVGLPAAVVAAVVKVAEAPEPARAVRRVTEIAVATARLAAASHDARRAAELLATLPAGGHSARAAAALDAAARSISTLTSTVAP